MRLVRAVMLVCLLAPSAVLAQQQTPPVQPAPGAPAAPGPQTPGAPTGAAPAPTASASRTFNAPAGLIFNAVRPERVADFEKVIAALEQALASSQDATVREQAKGWRVFRAAEQGPNGSVLYVFVIEPAVTGADYGLGRILAAAYPDLAKLQEVWKLYTDSLASGGSLLNLTPVKVDSPAEPAAGQGPAAAQDGPPRP